MQKPRIVVLGEKPQGAEWLTMLIASGRFEIIAGVPRHVERRWWGEERFETILRDHNIPVMRREDLGQLEYDILWSLMYGFIIEAEHIARAKWYGLNLHESPLPRHRGCNGYSHAILNDEKTFGTTFHFLAPALDAGEMIDQEIFPILPGETSKELYMRTMTVSAGVFKRNIDAVAERKVKGIPIDVSGEPIRPRSSLDGLREISVAERKNLADMERRARAFDFLPFEPAFYEENGKRYYVFVDGSAGRTTEKDSHVTRLQGPNRDLIVMEADLYKERYPFFQRAVPSLAPRA